MRPEPERLDIDHDAPPHLWERRRFRSIGTALATATVLAVAGIGAVDLLGSGRTGADRAPSAPSQPIPPDDVMSLRTQHMNGFRQVGFRTVTLIVPAHWGRNEITTCGFPYADTVLYPSGPRPRRACDSVVGARHSYVAFDPLRCPGSVRLHRDHELTRRLGQPTSASGLHRRHDVYEVQVELGPSALCIELSSPYRSVVERLVGTLRPRQAG